MKNYVFSFLIIISSLAPLYSQVEIRSVDLTGKVNVLNLDSVLNISRNVFDSVIIRCLTIPPRLEERSNCAGCSGLIIKSYLVNHKCIISEKILRGFDNVRFNDMTTKSHDKVVKKVLKYCSLDRDKVYIIMVFIRFDQNDVERIYIDKEIPQYSQIIISYKRKTIVYH